MEASSTKNEPFMPYASPDIVIFSKLENSLHKLYDDSLSLKEIFLTQKDVLRLLGSMHNMILLNKSNDEWHWKAISLLETVCSLSSSHQCIVVHCRRFTPFLTGFITQPHEITVQKKLRILSLLEVLTHSNNCGAVYPKFLDALLTLTLKQDDALSLVSRQVLVNILSNDDNVAFELCYLPQFKPFLHKICGDSEDPIERLANYHILVLMRPLLGTIKPDENEWSSFVLITLEMVQKVKGGMLSRTVDSFCKLIEKFGNQKLAVDGLSPKVESFLDLVKKCVEEKSIIREDASAFCYLLTALVKLDNKVLYEFYSNMMELVVDIINEKTLKCASAYELTCTVSSFVQNKDFPEEFSTKIVEVLRKICSQAVLELIDFISKTDQKDFSYHVSLLHFIHQGIQMEDISPLLKKEFQVKVVTSFYDVFLNDKSDFACDEEKEFCVTFLDCLCGITLQDHSLWTVSQDIFDDVCVLKLLAVSLKAENERLVTRVLSVITSTLFPGRSVMILSRMLTEVKMSPVWDSASLGVSSEDKVKEDLKYNLSELYELEKSLLTETLERQNIALSQAVMQVEALQNSMHVTNQIKHALQHELSCKTLSLKLVHDQFSASMKAHAIKIEEASELVSTLQQEIADLKLVVKLNEEDCMSLRKQNEDLHKEIRSINDSLCAKVNELSNMERLTEDLKKQVACLHQELTDSNDISEKRVKEVKKITTLFEEMKLENKELEKEKSKMSDKLSNIEERLAIKEKELEDLKRVREAIFEMAGGKKRI